MRSAPPLRRAAQGTNPREEIRMSEPPATNPQEHDRFPYSAIVDRKPLRWPKDARVAVWVIPNIEHFLFDRPSTSVTHATTNLVPDVLNYSWRDYGVRVGVWRLMEIMERHGVRGTVALNSDVCDRYPRIIEEGNRLGWEWMGHGTNNSTLINKQSEEEHRTLDLLAENKIEYVANWVNDEQPYPMRVNTGTMLSMPYSLEINDIPVFLDHHQSGEAFARMIRDQFDVLYEDGAKTGRVMAISLHPFLIGHPHRSKYFANALAHVTSRQDVWLATGSEIADWYKKNYLEAA
jgi:allantoinase